MVGFGGVFAEILNTAVCTLAPASANEACRLLERLDVGGILKGARGRKALDLAACAEVISRLSHTAAKYPELGALEINPLLVSPQGAIALDAMCERDGEQQ